MTELKMKKDTVVRVHYTGTLPDTGEVFDSSEGRDPLTFLVGHGMMIPGFEEEMMGGILGERREFTLEAARAYGERDENAVMQIPRAAFDQLIASTGATLEVGMTLVAQMPHGPAPFLVIDLNDEIVTADFNHALAGKSLTFSVEIVELREATEEEIAHGHAHGPGGVDH